MASERISGVHAPLLRERGFFFSHLKRSERYIDMSKGDFVSAIINDYERAIHTTTDGEEMPLVLFRR